MATVWIPALLRSLTNGQETVPVSGASVRQIVDNLESLYPGLKARLVTGDDLRSGVAVAINSQLARDGLAQKVPDGAEVHFIPAISGGSPHSEFEPRISPPHNETVVPCIS